MAENNGGFNAAKFSKTHPKVYSNMMYSDLTTDHPIDLVRYRVANCHMGRAGGMGLISGSKAFHKPIKEGIALLNDIQDVSPSKDITTA